MKAQFMIAAPTSGSGKTTLSRGLMALFAGRGYRVQPYKCGPDYIDTKFHAAVCGRPSVNLDTFMATPDHVRELFARYGSDADVCIVEGMMGLYDGYDRDRGSSAEIARVLGIPVVLVVDARSAAYSMAPLLYGFTHFSSSTASSSPLNIAGVIFNKVGSERHFAMLRQVCDDLHIACFGYLPKSAALEQASRYLGLDFSEHPETRLLTDLLSTHVNWSQLVGEASKLCNSESVNEASKLHSPQQYNLGKEEAAKLRSFTHYAPQFVDTNRYIRITSDKLPHWKQEGKTVFVTFRLADSLPQSKLQELQEFKAQWLNTHPLPWDSLTNSEYERTVRQKTERWLDQGYGSCLLRQTDVREMVVSALLFHHGTRYVLHHFVVMPNHVHLLATPIGDYDLMKTIGSVKRFTANAINKALGTKGVVWQRLMFDHLVRDAGQYDAIVKYIDANPRNLSPDTFTLSSRLVGEASKLCDDQQADSCNAWKRSSQSLSDGGDCNGWKRSSQSLSAGGDCNAWKRSPLQGSPLQGNPLRVMIARNAESFSFLYQETIDRLGDVTFFDPETDVPCLDDVGLLYLPGGYPEKHLEALTSNEACRKAIKDYAERGGRIHAECGGMMYLCRAIVADTEDEASPAKEYPMCGVLPYTITACKADRKLSLGYRRFELDGREYRGHEFHYTQFLGAVPPSACQVYNAMGEPVPTPVFRHQNVLASYTHIYQL